MLLKYMQMHRAAIYADAFRWIILRYASSMTGLRMHNKMLANDDSELEK